MERNGGRRRYGEPSYEVETRSGRRGMKGKRRDVGKGIVFSNIHHFMPVTLVF